ncbi:MAG: hypothetical protein HY913_19825 [Desulfomonile tiedjei]|nr:hypothetical protein [Desulfomonile tiedjei]
MGAGKEVGAVVLNLDLEKAPEEPVMKSEDHNGTPSPPGESRELNQSKKSGPCVGLFYFVAGQLYWEGVPTARADRSEYVKIYDKEYPEYWEEGLLPCFPQLKKYNAYHFPRGRVVFSTQEGIYRVQADKCILEDPGLVKRIISEMRLPESQVKMSWNVDCECAACKSKRTTGKDYIDRAIDGQLYASEEGRKLFFPWKSFWDSSHRGYIVPSAKEYARIRRGMSLWLRLGIPVMAFTAFSVAKYTWLTTGSRWLPALMALITCVPFTLAFSLWLRAKCRGLIEIDERYCPSLPPQERSKPADS